MSRPRPCLCVAITSAEVGEPNALGWSMMRLCRDQPHQLWGDLLSGGSTRAVLQQPCNFGGNLKLSLWSSSEIS